jgi:predicted nucleic acid-binding protein
MVIVDSSVWIDFFNDKNSRQTATLEVFIQNRPDVVVGDLILAEVLQGVRSESEFRRCLFHMNSFTQIQISDPQTAIQAARNYRDLRARGFTTRKTIDTLIATRCIMDSIELLYSDRDFDPFVEHLGLISAVPT